MAKASPPRTPATETERTAMRDTAEHAADAERSATEAHGAEREAAGHAEEAAHAADEAAATARDNVAEYLHDNDRELPTSTANARPQPQRIVVLTAIAIVLLAIIASGFYYFWPTGKSADQQPSALAAPATGGTQAPAAQTLPQNAAQQTVGVPVQSAAPAFQPAAPQQGAQTPSTTVQVTTTPTPQSVTQQAVQPQATQPAVTPAPAVTASTTVTTAPALVSREATEERIKLKSQREENKSLRQQLKDMQEANRQRDQNDFMEKMLSQQRQHDAERQREQDARLERALDKQRQNDLANRAESRNKVDALYAEVIRLQQRPIVVQVNMSSPAVHYQEQPQFQPRNVQMQICP